MTLKPQEVTPLSMHTKRLTKGRGPLQMQVIDWRHESHWHAIHHPTVNGVIQRRRPIRAIEAYLDTLCEVRLDTDPVILNQNRLRKELETRLPLLNDDDEMRRKFLINDLAGGLRVFLAQSQGREFCLQVCPDLPSDFTFAETPLFMVLSYRGLEVSFRQPNSKDVRTVSAYANCLFHGSQYQNGASQPVEWKCHSKGETPFYVCVTPVAKRAGRRL